MHCHPMHWYVGVGTFVVKRQLSRHPRNQAFLLSSSCCIVFWPGVIDVAAVDAVVAAEEGTVEEDASVEEGWDDIAALPCAVIEIAPAPGT